jgi:hypothetical protein
MDPARINALAAIPHERRIMLFSSLDVSNNFGRIVAQHS